MIVKNEEPVLARCLESAALFADEIIIVDTGSTDKTKEIAARYTQQVYDFVWIDDFAAARNHAYSYATMDYILWLDADDDFEQDSIHALCRLKQTLTEDVDVVTFLYGGDIDQQNLKGNDFLLRDRLVKRSLGVKWQYPIHEAIPILPEYRVLHAQDIVVLHRKAVVNEPARNMHIFNKMKQDQLPLNTFNRYFYCRELYLAERYNESVQEYEIICSMREKENILSALPYGVWSLQKLHDTEGAMKILLESLTLFPPNELVCCELGNCFLQKKNDREAELWYNKALAVTVDYKDFQPHFLAYQKFLPYLKLGVLFANRGDFDRALKYNEGALQVFPNNMVAKCNQLYYQKQIDTVT
ncbi:MAG: glycosyltransferase family 2 protein [Oscillospiraceae bacterium]